MAAEDETEDVIREAVSDDRINQRRADLEFRQLLRRNIERHAALLSRLADR